MQGSKTRIFRKLSWMSFTGSVLFSLNISFRENQIEALVKFSAAATQENFINFSYWKWASKFFHQTEK